MLAVDPSVDDHRAVTDGVDTGTRPPRGRALRRAGVLLVVVSTVGIWGYVMYLSFFEGRAEPFDQLDDTAWVEAAEATCAPTAAAIRELPYASELDTLEARAEALDDATDRLEPMIRQLRGMAAPAEPDDARAVGRWLDDWEVFLEDRRNYADAFRRGEDEPFVVTDRGGEQIDVLLDDFAAKDNDMPSCAPPDDVG